MNRRTVIVSGYRTPFIKAGTDFAELDVLDLAAAATTELLERSSLALEEVDHLVLGNVARPVKYHNLAREVGLAVGLPRGLPAHTVGLACASACVAVTAGVDLIDRGYAQVVIAGGSESLTNVPANLKPGLTRRLLEFSRARSVPARLRTLAELRPADLAPEAPAIRETSTGLTMGESAEIMAQINGVSREEQDALALQSHRRAARGWDEGVLQREVAPVYLTRDGGRPVTQDNHIRRDTSAEKLATLKPVFDRHIGTITAGNSSPLTDGAAVVLLMSEEKARVLGYTPLAAVRSYAYAAVDPGDQLLIAPAYAIPRALERAGIVLGDIGLVEMHEAFAAQVLSTLKVLASPSFAREELGRSEPVGEIDPERLNRWGGSIALGHPFGATGARVVTTLAHELARGEDQFGLISVCAAGGQGCTMVLEKAP